MIEVTVAVLFNKMLNIFKWLNFSDEEKMESSSLKLPRIGESAPTFTLPATEGSEVSLAAYPKPLALSFMRHLA